MHTTTTTTPTRRDPSLGLAYLHQAVRKQDAKRRLDDLQTHLRRVRSEAEAISDDLDFYRREEANLVHKILEAQGALVAHAEVADGLARLLGGDMSPRPAPAYDLI